MPPPLGFEHPGPCPFDRPTIASEMRQLQSSERAARNREISDREIKLSPMAPVRTAAGGAPHGNSTSDAESVSLYPPSPRGGAGLAFLVA